MPLSTSDKLYLTFFSLFIPAMALVDLVPFYPPTLVPAPVKALHGFYIDTFNDQLMVKSPPWFATFASIEAFYNFPVAVWLVFAILRQDPRAKIHMLVYGTVCTVTCWVCAVEMWHEPDMTPLQKQLTAGCYGPFCIIFPVMAVHNFIKIQEKIVAGEAGAGVGKVGAGKKRV